MNSFEVKLKIDQAIKAIEDYEEMIKDGDSRTWDEEIKKGLDILTEKRYVLGASGNICGQCGGSGRI